MPSVGPELPPHMTKRKRSIDEAEDPKSPPRKVLAATAPRVGPTLPPSKNPDELDVDDSSDDDYGPSLGPSKPASPPTKRVLGPAPPPAVGPSLPRSKNPDELDVEESSDHDGYGPSAPSTKPASAAQPPKRVLGPAPPPVSLSEKPSKPADEDSSSEDDDYGPSLPPPPGSAAESAYLLQRQQAEQEQKTSAAIAAAKPQRDDWMLVPPSDSDWTSRVDPTKLKNRKFASGKGAKAPAEKSGISAIWTETPEQKRQRLADEVLGRSDPSLNSSSHPSSSKPLSREDEATERRIREYNEKNRGKSLLDVRRDAQEKGRLEKEEEDDPSKRGFDREKDMALGGRMGHVKKKEMLSRAADFGSRFQRGKYL